MGATIRGCRQQVSRLQGFDVYGLRFLALRLSYFGGIEGFGFNLMPQRLWGFGISVLV